MRAIKRIWQYMRAFGSARRNRTDLVGWLIRRPQLLLSTLFFETMLLFANRLDPKLKELAELKIAGMINCEYCLDIGSALANSGGLTEQQILDLPKYKTSDAYSELEKLVLAYAEAVTLTPATGIAELREQLLTHLSKAQLAELAAAIAWENQRARINQALGVRATGMADGMVCALPESRPA
ncbi:carboxymuconolactone decarboxylase family protein [Nocardia sp. CDC159]|uniref:Carboxymuconolactone decarboxylase family protein n=1 Tax=Nocardia pulmonis TaxID=2951408 RepID=A0A9X2IW34_9NOCA|nr:MULTISPECIES: carboxymuconolactone decarboxylase family protein [Nocardia]MCM6773124.1 carboxymuconolactone decarboxylase family protein [Nocardia pulmonis]MCM6785573.1 carboxymuconolactone decarboxylase family protein [Nocardia sp. CDC159]